MRLSRSSGHVVTDWTPEKSYDPTGERVTQVDVSSLQDFLNERWLFDNTGHPEDVGYQAALQSLVDWFDLDEPEE